MARSNSSSNRSSGSNRGSSNSAQRDNVATAGGGEARTQSSRRSQSRRRGGGGGNRSAANRSPQTQRNPMMGSSGRGRSQSLGARALSVVSEHPIPLAMIGAGLAMLLVENRTGLGNVERRIMRQGRDLLGGVGETLSEYTSTARDALAGAAEYVGESLGPVAESVTERTSRLGEYVSSGASSVGHGVENAYEYGRDALADAWERHPIALCASILAAGVAAGMLLPSTRRENSLFGRTSDAVARKLREQGREFLSQGRELASEAAQSVAQTVNNLGFGGGAGNQSRPSGGSKSSRRRSK